MSSRKKSNKISREKYEENVKNVMVMLKMLALKLLMLKKNNA